MKEEKGKQTDRKNVRTVLRERREKMNKWIEKGEIREGGNRWMKLDKAKGRENWRARDRGGERRG
jgi:hypothetical protein